MKSEKEFNELPEIQNVLVPAEKIEKHGKITEALRIVVLEDGTFVIASQISSQKLVQAISKFVAEEPELIDILQKGMTLGKLRGTPFGEILYQMFTDSDLECNCPDCTAKRQKKAAMEFMKKAN